MNKIQALFDLTNQVALVTGGAGGLGKYYTQALLTAGADVLKVPLGHVLLIGIIVAIPTIIISGPVFNYFLQKFYPKVYKRDINISVLGEYKEFKLADTPSFGISVLTALLPVILIGIGTILSFILPKDSLLFQIVTFIGSPDVAMLLSLIVAIFTMGINRGLNIKEIGDKMSSSVMQIAMMLLIIGGGGAFKQVLVDGGVAKFIGVQLLGLVLLLISYQRHRLIPC